MQHDVIVIGGGPAGLQAALTLGRMHRRVLLLDSGDYRNAPAAHLHNVITHDGTPPAEWRARARADLTAYATVAVREDRAALVAPDDEGYAVTLSDGERVRARRLVLATGVRDTLPAVPGVEALFGSVVAHCPYCHGHEMAGTHVAVLGSGHQLLHLTGLMAPIAARLTVLSDGAALDPDLARALQSAGVCVRDQPIVGLCRSSAGATVSFADGPDEEVGAMFVTTTSTQAAPFAEQLGLDLNPSGCVRVDVLGRTSRVGVYAAGDLAHVADLPMPMASVLTAAAAGLVAGAAIGADSLADSLA